MQGNRLGHPRRSSSKKGQCSAALWALEAQSQFKLHLALVDPNRFAMAKQRCLHRLLGPAPAMTIGTLLRLAAGAGLRRMANEGVVVRRQHEAPLARSGLRFSTRPLETGTATDLVEVPAGARMVVS